MSRFKPGELLYENPLVSEKDIADWRLEGSAKISFPDGRMRMENVIDPAEGQKSNFVHWCPVEFPENIIVSWDFYPLHEPGLCILFFAAKGRGGENIFDPSLRERVGPYEQYYDGDINAYHISYFRRWDPRERGFQTCNLRKSHGFHLVAQGADPLPGVEDSIAPYRIQLAKLGGEISFAVNDLEVLYWVDDGGETGPIHGGGNIGFRQMAPLVAEYANLTVHKALEE